MSTLGMFLAAAAGPIAKRALTAIGLGVVSYVGVDLAVSGLLSSARSSWGGIGGDTATYLAMAGVNTAFSITAGAITARVTLLTLKRLALL